jgi:hypothetical protein
MKMDILQDRYWPIGESYPFEVNYNVSSDDPFLHDPDASLSPP